MTLAKDQLFRYNGVNQAGTRVSGITNAPSLAAAREELERYYETVQVFPAGLGETPAKVYSTAGRVRMPGEDKKAMDSKPFVFACDQQLCQAQIVGQVNNYLILEGMAADAGSWFIRNAAQDTRRFPTRADAEDFVRELAMDAVVGSYKGWTIYGQIGGSGMNSSGYWAETGRAPHFKKTKFYRTGAEVRNEIDQIEQQKSTGKKGEDSEMATDPPVSEAQRKAMFAAKSGHSTLGIPASVGKEFAAADPGGKLPEKAK